MSLRGLRDDVAMTGYNGVRDCTTVYVNLLRCLYRTELDLAQTSEQEGQLGSSCRCVKGCSGARVTAA